MKKRKINQLELRPKELQASQPESKAAEATRGTFGLKRAAKLHTDDRPVPALAPGNGKTKTGACGPTCWITDDRPCGERLGSLP